MSSTGFTLTRLAVIGPGVPTAEVRFQAGLNVIHGASNTGKTYIAQCIDYACGAGKEPKVIPEAEQYDAVLLGLRPINSSREMVFERSLRGGNISLRTADNDVRTLGAKHNPAKQDTVSYFLLDLAGLAGKMVRSNKYGKTRQLSFRDISRLIFIDEESVIRERSPIFSENYANKTAEGATFHLLLTGVDDSSVIEKEDPKTTKIRLKGKTEVVMMLLERTRAQLREYEVDVDEKTLREKLKDIEMLFERASRLLATVQESVALIEERRRKAWVHLRQVESRRDVLSELQKRFTLLQDQYTSDLRRLESISEAVIRLGQMREVRCPVCGALAEYHDHSHQDEYATPSEVANACQAEAAKIYTLSQDLQNTIDENKQKIGRLCKEQHEKQLELKTTGDVLRDRLQPSVQEALQAFRERQSERDECLRLLEIHKRIVELERILEEGKASTTESTKGSSTHIITTRTELFSKEVEYLLRAWQFPDLGRVTFNEDNQDVVISGQPRHSHGKGVRAITHAAFNLALLKYCIAYSMSHPGVVLIDSPLIVYKQPDQDENYFSQDVKDAFYRSIATTFAESQVIIIENESPPTDLGADANIIEFTGTEHGRRGFIPTPQLNE